MSLLVDTGVWFAYLHHDDERHDRAGTIVASCMEGRYGRIVTTRDVVDETLTLLLSRGAPRSAVEEFASLVGLNTDTPDPQLASILHPPTDQLWVALDRFLRHYEDKGLSFTDCTSIVAMRREGIDAIASFDDGFDGLVERVAE